MTKFKTGTWFNFSPPVSALEIKVYTFLIFGLLVDILTTYVGVHLPGIVEANPFSVSSMANGTWPLFEILYATINVLCCWLIMRSDSKYRNAVLILPFTMGAFRLICGIHNVMVIGGL